MGDRQWDRVKDEEWQREQTTRNREERERHSRERRNRNSAEIIETHRCHRRLKKKTWTGKSGKSRHTRVKIFFHEGCQQMTRVAEEETDRRWIEYKWKGSIGQHYMTKADDEEMESTHEFPLLMRYVAVCREKKRKVLRDRAPNFETSPFCNRWFVLFSRKYEEQVTRGYDILAAV